MRVNIWVDGQATVGSLQSPISRVHEVCQLWPAGLRGEEDEGWHWPDLLHDQPDGEKWRHYELIGPCQDERVQGLMIVRTAFSMRSTANLLTSGCYIEYLATAPWNRVRNEKRIDERYPRVAPIGSHLLRAAVRLSIELGFHGRLGWHSKPLSEVWYKRQLPALEDLGPDESEDGLSYFELTEGVASEFLERSETARVP